MNVAEHLDSVLDKVESHSLVRKVHVRSNHVSFKRGYIRLVATFADDSELHLFEYVNSQLKKVEYAYHYQQPSGTLIFRYDNAQHYPGLDSFPHHKHVAGQETPQSSSEMEVNQVLKEITRILAKKGNNLLH
ncbi:MAG: toxin-antitoxin system TumE family protein [Thermoproteota archaeon]